MAKSKKTNKVQQLLSPENYIRQRGRSLPIYECLVNDDWKMSGTVHVVIARKHVSGNLTLGMYLVDLLCLGVRDTHYRFNTSPDDYHDLLDMMSESLNMKKVDYVLVHNILLTAVEFAGDLGFKPCKDFTSITQHLLDEDTDDIELMEIECGRNGKPVFIKTDLFTESESQLIINQLEKSVGKLNFDIIYGLDGEEMDLEDEEASEYHRIDAEYDQMTSEERRASFLEITKNGLDAIPEGMHQRLHILTDNIYLHDVCDDDTVELLLEKWEAETKMKIAEDPFTAESLGVNPDRQISEQEVKQLDELFALTEDNESKALKEIDKLKKSWGEMPFLYYLEIKTLERGDFKKYLAKLDEYSALFPYYSLLKIEKLKAEILASKAPSELLSFEETFSSRTSITEMEMFEFLMSKLHAVLHRKNVNELEAMGVLLEDLILSEKYDGPMRLFLSLVRVNHLIKYFRNEEQDVKLSNRLSATYQFKIQLKNVSNPTVWRRMLVPCDLTFDDFHIAIQVAFGWEMSHLYFFSPSGYHSSPMIESSEFESLDNDGLDSLKTELNEIFDHEKQKFVYLYDSGDDWIHEITLEKILPDEHAAIPQILKGKGACPPEDCGGAWGYAELKQVLVDKKHPEHKEMRAWLGMKRGEEWDAERFLMDQHQQILNKCFDPNNP